jgi:hypothetical protein
VPQEQPIAIEELGQAYSRTLGYRTATLVYWREVSLPDEAPARSSSPGAIDFVQRRCRLDDHPSLIHDGGRRFERSPTAGDAWVVEGRVDEPPALGTPFWLLDLVPGIQSARAEPPTAQARDRRSLSCLTDLVTADAESRRGVVAPGGFPLRQLRAVPLRIELDAADRIVVVEATLGGWAAGIELRDLGTPTQITLPSETTLVARGREPEDEGA